MLMMLFMVCDTIRLVARGVVIATGLTTGGCTRWREFFGVVPQTSISIRFSDTLRPGCPAHRVTLRKNWRLNSHSDGGRDGELSYRVRSETLPSKEGRVIVTKYCSK